MPEISQDQLESFGRAVKTARAFKGWTLDTLAFQALGRDNAKGYLSQIEKGKRKITARTAAQIIKALEMDQDAITPFIGAAEVAEDEFTLDDTKAERLMEMAKQDETAQNTSEALLISLAYEFAHGSHNDLFSAIKGLRSALQEAANLKARGNLPQNVDDQLQQVMRRVSALNDAGDRDGAQAEIDAAFKRNDAERSALRNIALSQARINNDPEAATKLIVQQLREEARPEGLWQGIVDVQRNWADRGKDLGTRYEKEVALRLAKRVYERAKGPNKYAALSDLGRILGDLGEQDTGETRLKNAEKALRQSLRYFKNIGHAENQFVCITLLGSTLILRFERNQNEHHLTEAETILQISLKKFSSSARPANRADASEALGNVQSKLGELNRNPTQLQDAITAYEAALEINRSGKDISRYGMTLGNIGVARLRLGRVTRTLSNLDAAQSDFDAELAIITRTGHPFIWAFTQWNLADLNLARHEISPAPAQLDTAQSHLDQAREVFAEGLSHHQLERCDALQGRIDAARAGAA